MSLTNRHRWCISKVVDAFAPALEEAQVQGFIRTPANLERFNSFFRGEGASKLFIFYQVITHMGGGGGGGQGLA